MASSIILARSTGLADEALADTAVLSARLSQLAGGQPFRLVEAELNRSAEPRGPCLAVRVGDQLLGYVFATARAG